MSSAVTVASCRVLRDTCMVFPCLAPSSLCDHCSNTDAAYIGSTAKTGVKRKLEDDAVDGTEASSVPVTPSKKGPVKKKGIAQIKKKTKYQTDDENDEDSPKTPKPTKKRTARNTVKVEVEDPGLNGDEALVGEDDDVSGFAAEIA